jgi:hypothetical protein
MGIWGWVQAIATGWFVLSILAAVAWALVGKRIFRQPPRIVIKFDEDAGDVVDSVVTELKRRNRMGGA